MFRIVFTRRLDKPEAVAARERAEDDFDPEKSRRSERVMGHVYRLLETRGRAAAVDERAAAQMAAQGMTPDEIAETALMLDLMQRQNVAAEKKERLATLVEEVGGAPNPMNLALAQETVCRAFAEANFQSERRRDGARVEIEKTIADILESRAKAPVDAIDRAETTPVAAPSRRRKSSFLQSPPKRRPKAPETKMRPRRRQTLRPRRRRVPPRRRERSH